MDKKVIVTDQCFTPGGFTKLGAKLQKEHERQIQKWGIQTRSIFEWLCYTTEELGELAEAIAEYVYREGNTEEIVKEAIQTATLCLKIAEMYLDSKEVKSADSSQN